MKIALIGYGAMGKLIRRLAEEKGHEVVVVIDESFADSSAESLAAKLSGAEVAIDFTVAEAVKRNVSACVLANIPLVEGTTGWNKDREAIESIVSEGNGAFVFGANFSIGVNLFYKVANFAAKSFFRSSPIRNVPRRTAPFPRT